MTAPARTIQGQGAPVSGTYARPAMGSAVAKPLRQTADARLNGRRDANGYRTAPKMNKFGAPTRAAEKAAQKRHEHAVKAETRVYIWQHRSDVCEYCGDAQRVTATKHWKSSHEADEVRERSLTRGQAPEIRFASENTARACGPCHRRKTEHQIAIRYLTDRGMNGSYEVVAIEHGRVTGVLRTVTR